MSKAMRLFAPQPVRSGTSVRFRFEIQCHKCPSGRDFIDHPAKLPDEVVAKKFSGRQWVIGRNPGYHVCPDCVRGRAQPANLLAETFKVKTADGQTVTPVSEIVAAEVEAERLAAQAKTDAALDRFFRKPDETPKTRHADDPLAQLIAHDIGEIRAAQAVQIELERERNAMMARHLELLEQHMACWNRQLAAWEDQIRLSERQAKIQELSLRALSPIAPTLDRNAQALAGELRRVIEEPAPVHDGELAVRPRIEGKADRRRVEIVVASTAHRKGFLVRLRLKRQDWEAMGFTAEDRYRIEFGEDAVHVRRDPNGVKPARVGPGIVALQSYHQTRLDFTTKFVTVEDGAFHC